MKSLTEPQKFAEHILNKAWLMFETTPAHPFFIGDNPVTLQNNTQPMGPLRGNLGLAVRGIEIYLPVSSTLTLAFFCRSHEEMVRDERPGPLHDRAHSLDAHAEQYVFSSQPDFELVESMITDDARFRVGPRPEIG